MLVDPAVVAGTFPLVALAELPDKTMFATLLLSTRGRPLAVWSGVAAAFTVHVAIATTVGAAVFQLLPHRGVEALAAALFLGGAVLAAVEARRHGQAEAAPAEGDLDPADADALAAERPLVGRVTAAHRRAVVVSFVVIFVAEWGDLTQILTANLAARSPSPLSVALGALGGMWLVAALAVTGGRNLLRLVPVWAVRWLTAAVLLVLAAYTAAQAA